MVWIPPATFRMGSDRHYAEESPSHAVEVDGFWIDRFTTTNREFYRFVDATGYKTVAELPLIAEDYPDAPPEHLVPGALVFRRTGGPVDLRHLSQWWTWTPGAHWRQPEGSGSSIASRMDHPVVQVAYDDAQAYATWAAKDLPTEAEWECAARGGLENAEFVWGDDRLSEGKPPANWWQGEFPWQNTRDDGFEGSAPVGSYPPNGFGLHDMAGNVWEWTSDWYTARHPEDADEPCCVPSNPQVGTEEDSYDLAQPQFQIPRKVIKGGSFLCADNYCRRYRPAARRPQMIDTGMSHVGFRCIVRPPDVGC
jgi:formylglycine-generating enzyme required for sulfatase activity